MKSLFLLLLAGTCGLASLPVAASPSSAATVCTTEAKPGPGLFKKKKLRRAPLSAYEQAAKRGELFRR